MQADSVYMGDKVDSEVCKWLNQSEQQLCSMSVGINPVSQDEQCQSGAFLPPYYLPGHQQTSYNQSYQFLSEGTQNLPSMTVTNTSTTQPQTGGLQYYSGTLSGLQSCFTTTPNPNHNPSPNANANQMPAGPVSIVHVGTPHLVPQTLQMPSGYSRAVLVGQQMMRNPTVSGDHTASQLHKASSSLRQGVTSASSHNSKNSVNEILQKREVRLIKNREAARECRRKKKEYIKCLENRVAVLEKQNKALLEELRGRCQQMA